MLTNQKLILCYNYDESIDNYELILVDNLIYLIYVPLIGDAPNLKYRMVSPYFIYKFENVFKLKI